MTISIYNIEDVHKHQTLHKILREEEEVKISATKMMPSLPSLFAFDSLNSLSEDEDDSQSSASSDDYEYDEELGLTPSSNLSDEVPRRVTWAPAVVTDVRLRPRTTVDEKDSMYYTYADQQRFRQEYKMQIKAVQRLRTEKQLEKSKRDASQSDTPTERQHHLLINPLSGFINVMTTYFARSNSVQQNSGSAHTRKSSSLETTTLIDTLYLF
uniref:Uncharacterized protein n=1 Tax=Chaetoceros debilis TaxID=122233 RepID=A0A7S3VH70_9STRA